MYFVSGKLYFFEINNSWDRFEIMTTRNEYYAALDYRALSMRTSELGTTSLVVQTQIASECVVVKWTRSDGQVNRIKGDFTRPKDRLTVLGAELHRFEVTVIL